MRRTKVLQMDVQSDQVLSFLFSKMLFFLLKLRMKSNETVKSFIIPLLWGSLRQAHFQLRKMINKTK